jgi:histidine triad (HIT) family protein
MDGCVFCAIVSGAAAAGRVYGDDLTLAFMDINPATTGHTLVIPKRHARDLTDLAPSDLAAMAATAQRVGKAALRGLNASGVNLMLSSGQAAFQTVYHIHCHVIPRYDNDAIRLPWVPRPGDKRRIAEAAESLKSALGSLRP